MRTPKGRQGAGDDEEDRPIGPPCSLHHRWKPVDKSQRYMMGTDAGEPKKIITNVSARMNKLFCDIVQDLHKEAAAGRFSTKQDAVRGRGELILSTRKQRLQQPSRLHQPSERLMMMMSAMSLTARIATFDDDVGGTFLHERAVGPPERASDDDVGGEFDGQCWDF